MMDDLEDTLLPISALQHLVFCERQCALIHVERLWVENRLTIEGRQLHDRAHEGPDEYRANTIVARGLPLRSTALGLFGVADVVELHRDANDALVPNAPVRYERVIPIEYKRGKPKKDDSDRVQLCAQALCLEEMFNLRIELGYLFYGKRKRRTKVELDEQLRETTLSAVRRLREIMTNNETPRARREPKCDSCSLVEFCLPAGTAPGVNAHTQFQKVLVSALATEHGPKADADFDAF